jgi:hypothetical protein
MNHEMYKDALDSQDACNLSGLVKTLAGHMEEIWIEARAAGKGTGYVNTHPVVRLFLEQMVHLNGCGFIQETQDAIEEGRSYKTAYGICKERAHEPKVRKVGE